MEFVPYSPIWMNGISSFGCGGVYTGGVYTIVMIFLISMFSLYICVLGSLVPQRNGCVSSVSDK